MGERETILIWFCEHCGTKQKEYAPNIFRVILKNDPLHQVKWLCNVCHKNLTKEKKIEQEFL
jgi:hypothetical protein